VFNPTTGFYLSLEGDVAGLIGTSSNRFVRGIIDVRSYIPWHAGITFSSGVRAGAVHEYRPSESVPITERFFAGGGASIRGFGEKLVGPDSLDPNGNVIPVGGRYSLILHVVEMRFPLYKILSGAVFFDAGNVWGSLEEIPRTGLRASAGAGIRFNIPLGVIRLDGGLRLNRNPYYPREPIGAIHFEIGQAF
jgi:outer membrane protein assembly factor BamA